MTGINHALTKEQQEIVDYKGDEILVRGIAGSGKTLVMLRKAKLTAEKYPDQKVAVFTYNRTLAQASRLLMEELQIKNLHINTFHSWALRTYGKIIKKGISMVNRQDNFFKDAIKKMKKTENHRFIKEESKYKEFLKDEIAWIKGKGINTLEGYLEANRRGRGSEVRVTSDDRRLIFKVFNAYNEEKGNKLDYDDVGFLLSKRLAEIPEEMKFDHIFIDEAQDLQQIQLFVLKSIARKSFFIAADKGQKIYKTSFAWRDIGLNITGGRTKILRESFRSTKDIIQLAASLQQNDSIVNDDEYVELELPSKTGPRPTVIQCSTKEVHDVAVASAIKEMRKKRPEATIAILARESRKLYRIRHALKAENIDFEFVNKDNANPYTPGVKLCTMHSSKGLEFDYVIVIDLVEQNIDKEMDTEEYWELERRLLYVCMTRATTYLQLYYYDNESRLLKELNPSLYEKVVL